MSPKLPLQQNNAAGWESQGLWGCLNSNGQRKESRSSSSAWTQKGEGGSCAPWAGGVLTVLVRGGQPAKSDSPGTPPKCQQL